MSELSMDYVFKSGIHEFKTVRDVFSEDKNYLLELINKYYVFTDDVMGRLGLLNKNNEINHNIMLQLNKIALSGNDDDIFDDLENKMLITKYESLIGVCENMLGNNKKIHNHTSVDDDIDRYLADSNY